MGRQLTNDATWVLPGAGELSGKDVFFAAWQKAMANFSFVGFFASAGPIIVDAEANTASGTWYQQELLHYNDGNKRTVIGRYDDTYAKIDGRWYFTKRIYSVLNAE